MKLSLSSHLSSIRKLLLALFCLLPALGLAQGDCPSSATEISQCGFAYSGNNGSFSACGDGTCGGDCSCGGGSSVTSWDNDCSTNHPGTNCGCDLDASTENNMFWYFSVSEQCDYDVCVTADNCNNSCGGPAVCGVQAQVFQMDGGSVTQYLASETGSQVIYNGNTTCFTVNIDPADGDVYIMVDGYDGDECDVDVEVTEQNCSQCTLPIEMENFEARRDCLQVNLKWKTASESNSDRFVVQKKLKGGDWSGIGTVQSENSTSGATYFYTDKKGNYETTYYRLKQVDFDGKINYHGPIVVEEVPREKREVRAVYDLYGNQVGENHEGFCIVVYEDGSRSKAMKHP